MQLIVVYHLSNQISRQFELHKHFLLSVISAFLFCHIMSEDSLSRPPLCCCIILVTQVMYQRWDLCEERGPTVLRGPRQAAAAYRLWGDLTLAWNFTCNLACNITKLLLKQRVARAEARSCSVAATLTPASDGDF